MISALMELYKFEDNRDSGWVAGRVPYMYLGTLKAAGYIETHSHSSGIVRLTDKGRDLVEGELALRAIAR
jgi:hypothetical protein